MVDEQRLQRLASAVRGSGDAGLSAWGQPWSSSCSWSASPQRVSSEEAVAIPAWLQGRWRVSSTALDKVSFPIGRKFITESMPGVRMASVLPLPNIGNAPTGFEVQYGATPDADRGENAKATLEAFWSQSRVLSVASPRASDVRLRYSSPTKSMPSVNQTVLVQLCSSEGGLIGSGGSGDDEEFVLAEVFQQDNEDQGTRGEYEVVTSFRREGEAAVRVRQRVAAFLQPTDGAYFEAAGKPVALYDYTFRYSRP